uniref:L-dopachrome isomerase n=1 Tax=Candidatus Kentrum sp. MB TaxID=2138164 RepID=A0A451BDI5_9GAMM|nr:MAG: Phenylpyruvate tautomerase PptA, 4-oxalocrotonate tautomerase family [Candidatus Kentron sp. MB]VFK76305.1 MAG: Phenylpyruvate tautomerase PptA, 4-oxalocrotonate tautomerase family [Candidatus Kentron sp. MB]
MAFFTKEITMPYLKIQTNIVIDDSKKQSVLAKVSADVAQQMGKPERYMMTAMDTGCAMTLGGTDQPLACVELKALDLSESHTSALSDAICRLLQEQLNIPQDRTYIVFADIPRAMWGWNGGTF